MPIAILPRQAPYPADCWQLHIDGSAMPNPGRMGIGAVLRSPDGVQQHLSQALPDTGCNNEAELQALAVALAHLPAQGAQRVVVHTDSRVLIEQLVPPAHGVHRPIARLAAHFAAVRAQLQALEYVELRWVPRHRNGQADALARAALVYNTA